MVIGDDDGDRLSLKNKKKGYMVPEKVITNFYNLSYDFFKYFVITIFYLHLDIMRLG